MKWSGIFLLIFLTTACANSSSTNDVKILSYTKQVDQSSPESTICDDFTLTESEVKKYFSYASEVSSTQFHYESLILPCKYQGKLTLSNNQYEFEIYAGGSGMLFSKNNESDRYFICTEDSCCNQFKNLC